VSGWGEFGRRAASADDLTDGMRVLHAEWDVPGAIRKEGGRTLVRWDTTGASLEVSPQGPVRPADLVILGEGA
jgi:hypothetical protein